MGNPNQKGETVKIGYARVSTPALRPYGAQTDFCLQAEAVSLQAEAVRLQAATTILKTTKHQCLQRERQCPAY